MDGQKKYTFRNMATGATTSNSGGNNGSNRSQWRGMDLHTTTSTGNRRAMVAMTASPSPQVNNPNVPNSETAAKVKVEDAAISARNVLLRRKLQERKRFDSADHAMKQVMKVMDSPSEDVEMKTPEEEVSTAPSMITPAQAASAIMNHGKVGVSVFFNAMNAGDPTSGVKRQDPVSSSPNGALGNPSASGALSARNVLIQKKLREKRHFDSADYQLAQYNKEATAITSSLSMEDIGGNEATSMEIEPTPKTEVMNIDSPSAVGMRNAQLFTQMSPSTREPSASGKYDGISGTNVLLRRKLADRKSYHARDYDRNPLSTPDPPSASDKYAGLSGANALLNRKMAEKKRFDSADYNMNAKSIAAQARSHEALKHQQQSQYYQSSFPQPLQPQEYTAPPAPIKSPVAGAPSIGGSNYGRLCAANVLIRKKLKDRKRFDSADYMMEKTGHSTTLQIPNEVTAAPAAELYPTREPSQLFNPQVKHLKLSVFDGESRWGAVANASPQSPVSVDAAASEGNRVAARNIIIRRKLAERKRFDSADYFAAKEAASRG